MSDIDTREVEHRIAHILDKRFLNGLEAAMKVISILRCKDRGEYDLTVKMAYDRCYDEIMSIHEEFLSKSKEVDYDTNRQVD